MKFGIKDSLLEDIVKILSNYKSIDKAVIFGSRTREDHKYNSDIDMAVYTSGSENISGSLMSDFEKLYCLFKIDVIDIRTVTNKNLLKKIEEQGVEIYRKERK